MSDPAPIRKVVLDEALERIDATWHPHVVAELNGQEVKLARLEGPFVRHAHEHEDELFLVLSGRLTMELPEQTVELGRGELLVVPRGVPHRPVAHGEVHVLLFEPAGTVNTGDADDARRVDPGRLT